MMTSTEYQPMPASVPKLGKLSPSHLRRYITKRHKFALLSAVAAAAMAIQFFYLPASWGLPAMIVLAYLTAIWAVNFDLKKEEWVVLPLYLLLATSAIYAWLAMNASSQFTVYIGAGLYGVVVYVLLLTMNILNIATIRPLPLARSAHAVLGMAGLLCSFSLIYLALINQPLYVVWAAIVAAISWFISWPLLWNSMAAKHRLKRSLAWSTLVAALMGQLALVIGVWPSTFMTSLSIAGMLFVVLGVLHHQEKKLLSRPVQQQYLLLGGGLLVMLYVITQW